MNELNKKSKTSMIVRIISAIVFVIIFLPAIILGGWFFLTAVFVLLCSGIYEICKLGSDKIHTGIFIVSYFCGILIFLMPFVYDNDSLKSMIFENRWYVTSDSFKISVLSSFLLLVLLIFISIVDKKISISNVFYYFATLFLVAVGFYSFCYIRYLPSASYIVPEILGNIEGYTEKNVLGNDLRSCLLFFYIISAVMINDVGAYFTGVLFGKHKMIERISPNKTWEGFVGGVVISIIFSISFAATFEFGFNMPLLPNVICFQNNLDFGSSLYSQPFWFLILISVIIPFIANLGDLFFSQVKRSFKVKDFSNVMPGHGGVIDRFDSSIFTFILISSIIMLIGTKCFSVFA